MLRDLVLVDQRAHRRDHAAHGRQVLGRLRHAMHPAQPLTGIQLRVALGGFAQQRIGIAPGDDGVDLRVDAVDMRQIGAHDLDTGHLAASDRIRQGMRRHGDDGVQAGGVGRRGEGHARVSGWSWSLSDWRVGQCTQTTYYATWAACGQQRVAQPASADDTRRLSGKHLPLRKQMLRQVVDEHAQLGRSVTACRP
ncbi:hypothetical protein D3C73_812800 [compost metagenome]